MLRRFRMPGLARLQGLLVEHLKHACHREPRLAGRRAASSVRLKPGVRCQRVTLFDLKRRRTNDHVSTEAIYPVQYDVLKDFEPVSRLPVSRLWLVGKIGLPAGDAAELITWLKANPEKASAATAGIGSAAHLNSVLFVRTKDCVCAAAV